MGDDRAVREDELHVLLAAAAVDRVLRVRRVGADDLHRAGLVEAEGPLGDVEVVGAPVAVVAGAEVVVEAPEHRVEGVDAARRALVGVGRPRRGAEPHVPVHVGVRGALGLGVVDVGEEAVGLRGAAEERGVGALAVVAVDVLHVADEAVADDHAGRAELAARALPGAGLEDALVLLLGLHDELRLLDAVGEGLLAIDVLAGLHRLDGHVGVPMVGGDDDDHGDRLVLDDLAEVGLGLADARVGLLLLVGGVGVVDALGAVLAADAVAVAHRADDDGEFQELRQKHVARLNAAADEGEAWEGGLDGLGRGFFLGAGWAHCLFSMLWDGSPSRSGAGPRTDHDGAAP